MVLGVIPFPRWLFLSVEVDCILDEVLIIEQMMISIIGDRWIILFGVVVFSIRLAILL